MLTSGKGGYGSGLVGLQVEVQMASRRLRPPSWEQVQVAVEEEVGYCSPYHLLLLPAAAAAGSYYSYTPFNSKKNYYL